MQYAADLIGRAVIDRATGRRLGDVQDVLIDAATGQVTGLLLDDGGWFGRPRAVAYRSVLGIDGGAVQVAVPGWLGDGDVAAPSFRRVQGMRAYGQAGADLGTVDDVVFEPGSGRVVAFQLSHGFWDDLLTGKRVVWEAGPFALGPDGLTMADRSAEAQPGGELE